MIAVGPEVLNRNFQTTGAAGATCREGGGVGDGGGMAQTDTGPGKSLRRTEVRLRLGKG